MYSLWRTASLFFSLAGSFALTALNLHLILILTDLEADVIGPYEAVPLINWYILPEFVLQGMISVLLLLSEHWILFLLSLPLTCYHAKLFFKRQHLVDVLEVFRNINFEKKHRLIKICYYLFFFAIFICRVTLFLVRMQMKNEDVEFEIF